MITIHQFTPAVTWGDGVTAGVLLTRDILRELGCVSHVYTRHPDPSLNEIFLLDEYRPSPDQTLICHLAIGYEDHARLMQLPDRKILAYHNITPPHFFSHNPALRQVCELGRAQLQDARQFVVGSYADSDYNAAELAWYGYPAPLVIPLLINVPEQLPPPQPHQNRANFTLLFVGRVVTNKCQHQLVDTLYWLKQQTDAPLQLVLVGGVSDPDYHDFLCRHITALGLNDIVTMADKVSDAELAAYYQQADLYLSLSEHEGFGIPLVEAVMRGVPVLAFDTGGIRTSLGEVGRLGYKAPDRVGRQVLELLHDYTARNELLAQQQEHLAGLRRSLLVTQFVAALQGWGVSLP